MVDQERGNGGGDYGCDGGVYWGWLSLHYRMSGLLNRLNLISSLVSTSLLRDMNDELACQGHFTCYGGCI